MLQQIVASKLRLDWSPEQISGWLKIQYPDDPRLRVSHETIYRSLFIQARGVLKKELADRLRYRGLRETELRRRFGHASGCAHCEECLQRLEVVLDHVLSTGV
jgi:IS30 family transposase